MDVIIFMIGCVLTLIFICCFISVLGYRRGDKAFCLFILPCVLAIFYLSVETYDYTKTWNKPHHGEQPTLKDVNNGEAHIERFYITNGKDTVTSYVDFVWND